MLLQFGDKTETTARITVAAVGKGMDINFRELVGFADIRQCFEMIDMRMHTAIAHQAEQVQGFVVFLCITDGCQQGGVVGQRTVAYGYIDALQFLVNDTAGTQVEVTHFRIAHLPVGQTDQFTAGGERGVRVLAVKGAGKGRVCVLDGVGRCNGSESPAVHYNQNSSFSRHNGKNIF